MRLLPIRSLGECGRIVVIHAVGFNIRLASHIQPVFVAKIIPVRVIRIMAGANGIESELLNNSHIPVHFRMSHGITAFRRNLMPVHAFNENALAVHEQHLVPDLNGAEAYTTREPVAAMLKRNAVEFRIVGRPQFKRRNRLRMNDIAIVIAHRDAPRLRVGRNREVGQSVFLFGNQPYVAENPRKPPEVLIFKITAVAELSYLHLQNILFAFCILCG